MINAAAQELLAAVGESLARSAPEGWTQVKLRISAACGMTRNDPLVQRAPMELQSASAYSTTTARYCRRTPWGDVLEADRGAGYDAYFTLDRSGELGADFDYDSRSFDGDAEADLMVEDQRLFPRSQELLPAWHPSRTA